MISTSELLRAAAGIAAVAAVLFFLSALSTARQSRRAAYYSVRRDAQRASTRRLSASGLSLLAAAVLAASSVLVPAIGPPAPTAEPAPTASVAEMGGDPTPTTTTEPTAAPTAGVTVSPRPLDSPLNSPVPTPAAIRKATPILEPTSALISPLPTPTPAVPTPTPGPVAPNKRLVLNAIATGIDENGLPLDVGTAFTRGVKTIYVFFDYRDVPPSALLRQSWFRNGGSVNFRSERFGLTGNGLSYVSWSPRNGFRAGLYEVRLALGGMPQFVANFEVK